jgi:hypothetical protein
MTMIEITGEEDVERNVCVTHIPLYIIFSSLSTSSSLVCVYVYLSRNLSVLYRQILNKLKGYFQNMDAFSAKGMVDRTVIITE